MKKVWTFIRERRWAQVGLALVLVSAISLGVLQVTTAALKSDRKKVVSLTYEKSYDVSIGRAGVFIPNSIIKGTLVLERFDHPPNNNGCGPRLSDPAWTPDSGCSGGPKIIWIQGMMEVQIYEGEEGSRKMGVMKGLGYIYFNLDVLTRRTWDELGDDRMSIWYWHSYINDWVQCPTTLIRDASSDRGRLVCYWEEFGKYGLGWKQEPFINKLIKFGWVTVTPTPDD
jgi:hypothetical protein